MPDYTFNTDDPYQALQWLKASQAYDTLASLIDKLNEMIKDHEEGEEKNESLIKALHHFRKYINYEIENSELYTPIYEGRM